jgi:predicted HTH transcriptional regulator
LDVLALQYQLNKRQKLALESLLEKEEDFTIQEYELLCPGIKRRTLQRDLSDLIKKDLISQVGIKKAARYRINLRFFQYPSP